MAFLEPQNIPVTFDGGIKTIVDELQLQPNNLLIEENVRHTKQGHVAKRPGFRALSQEVMGGGRISSAVACQVFNDELLVFDGRSVFSYLEEAGQWVSRGTAISVIEKQRRIIRTSSATQLNPDGIVVEGFEVYAWEDQRSGKTTLRYAVVDGSSGSFAVADQVVAFDGLQPKTIQGTDAVGNPVAQIFYAVGTTMQSATVSPERPSIPLSGASGQPPTSWPVDGRANGFGYDVAQWHQQPIIAYDGAQGISLVGGPIIDGNRCLDMTVSGGPVACIVDSLGFVWVAYAGKKNGVYGAWVNRWDITSGTPVPLFNQGGSSVRVDVGIDGQSVLNANVNNIALIETTSGGSVIVCFEYSATTKVKPPYSATLNYSTECVGVVAVNANVYFDAQGVIHGRFYLGTIRGVGLASKPFKDEQDAFVNVLYQSVLPTGGAGQTPPTQSTYFTACLTQPGLPIVAKAMAQTGGLLRSNKILAQCDGTGNANEYLYAGQQLGTFQVQNGASVANFGVASTRMHFDNSSAFNSVESANNLVVVGGIPQTYDGVSFVEQNFHVGPEGLGTIPLPGGQLTGGTYTLQATYEWADNFGQVQRSQPSPGTVATVTAGQQLVVFVPTLRLTAKVPAPANAVQTTPGRSPVQVVLYATPSSNSQGQIAYRVASSDNDPLSDSIAMVFNVPDAEIETSAPIYTTSQLMNGAPPACALIALYQGRVAVSGLEDPFVSWVSQNRFDNSEYNTLPVEFSPELTIGCDHRGDAITAIGVLDANLVLFKRETIFIVSGDGPAADGTGSSWPDPQMLTSDTGSINPNSLVFSPMGLFFQSAKGIYLLDRNLSVEYKGSPVADFNELTITSATLLPSTNEIVWATTTGTFIVYNYLFDTWGTWTTFAAADSCIWNGALTYVRPDGLVLIQASPQSYTDNVDPGQWTDNGRQYTRKIQLPWLSFGEIQGYRACYYALLIGQYLAEHSLQIDVEIDYTPGIKQTSIFDGSIMASGRWGGTPAWGREPSWGQENSFSNYQFRINFKKKFIQSIRLTISENAPNASGTWSAMTFSVGSSGRIRPIPRSNIQGGA